MDAAQIQFIIIIIIIMESVLKSLNHLSQVISDDREIPVKHSSMFLSMLEISAGFVKLKATNQDPMNSTENEASTGGKSSRYRAQKRRERHFNRAGRR